MGWWYLPLLLLSLLIWQSLVPGMLTTKTIDYSVFLDYLTRGEVDECKIEDTEIVGHITPKQPAKEKAPAKGQVDRAHLPAAAKRERAGQDADSRPGEDGRKDHGAQGGDQAAASRSSSARLRRRRNAEAAASAT